jgi:hypothetical protein
MATAAGGGATGVAAGTVRGRAGFLLRTVIMSSWRVGAWALAPRAADEMGLALASVSLAVGGVSSVAIAPMPNEAVLMMQVVASRNAMRRRETRPLMVPNPAISGHSRHRDSPAPLLEAGAFSCNINDL